MKTTFIYMPAPSLVGYTSPTPPTPEQIQLWERCELEIYKVEVAGEGFRVSTPDQTGRWHPMENRPD